METSPPGRLGTSVYIDLCYLNCFPKAQIKLNKAPECFPTCTFSRRRWTSFGAAAKVNGATPSGECATLFPRSRPPPQILYYLIDLITGKKINQRWPSPPAPLRPSLERQPYFCLQQVSLTCNFKGAASGNSKAPLNRAAN